VTRTRGPVGCSSATAAYGHRVRVAITVGAPAIATLTPAGAESNGHDQDAVGERQRPRRVLARPAGRVGVVVADAHPLYLESLERNVRAWPEFELLAVAEGPELLDTLEETSPRVLVVDHTTIGIDRDELFDCAGRCSRMLLICTDPEPAEIYDAMADGASGYLAKDCPKQELCHTIAALGRGEERLGASVQPALAKEIRLREVKPREVLTAREREILLMMCEGLSAPDIGRQLCIGTPTVKTHQHHLFEKLEASERAMAVAHAFRRHLIE
jgi:two-component system, NarL family, nitrate/nitrite response regulator NarL